MHQHAKHFCGYLSIIPSCLMAMMGIIQNDQALSLWGLVTFAIIWELKKINKAIKENCWY